MIERLNLLLFYFINRYAKTNPVLDKIAVLMAQYFHFAIMLLLLFLWFKKGETYKRIALYCVYTALLGLLINFVITLFYFHPRPFMIHIGKLLIKHQPETSFPSDHTTFSLSIALMISAFKETRVLGIILVILALLQGLARVYCGLHFPFDVLGSILISLFSFFVVFNLRKELEPLNKALISIYLKIWHK